jgi:hypothetical protein
MIEKFHSVPWPDYTQPEWNTETSVADALSSVWSATDPVSSSAAYSELLYAVGNNHAGTYYPVLLAVVPFMEGLLRTGGPWSVRTVLDVLIDLLASFEPAPGYDTFEDTAGTWRNLADSFEESVHRLRPSVEHIATGGGLNADIARELISLVDDVARSPPCR